MRKYLPTYQSGTRVARVALMLAEHRRVTVDEIAERVGVSVRTAGRYLTALRLDLWHEDAPEGLLQLERYDGTPLKVDASDLLHPTVPRVYAARLVTP